MFQLIIPCHWNKKILNQIDSLEDEEDKIKEIYGVLPDSLIPHGRSPDSVPEVSTKEAVNFRKLARKKEYDFIYLLNAPFSVDSEKKKEITEYLDWVIKEFEADSVMISSLELMRFVRELYPDLDIYISTIAGVENAKDLNEYLEIDPKRVVVHHDLNRDFGDLDNFIEKCAKENIEVEMMLTESCLRNCPNRKAHYEFLSKKNSSRSKEEEKVFHATCNSRKLKYPFELLRANWIRPEDVSYYKDLGIDNFKITGRSQRASWLPEVVEAYINEEYEGNLVRLLDIDPDINAEDHIYIENKSLKGFIENFPKGGFKEERKYSNKWIKRLYDEGSFKLLDGSDYEVNKEGILELKKAGSWASKIIEKEKIE